MDECCQAKAVELRSLRDRHHRVLVSVLIINAALFVVEAAAGLLASSTALIADSLDMFGDALVYGFSLYVLGRSAEWKAKAALLKGMVMALFGAGVLIEAVHKTTTGIVPTAEAMTIVGTLVLQLRLLLPAFSPPGRRSEHALDLALLAKRHHRQHRRIGRGGAG